MNLPFILHVMLLFILPQNVLWQFPLRLHSNLQLTCNAIQHLLQFGSRWGNPPKDPNKPVPTGAPIVGNRCWKLSWSLHRAFLVPCWLRGWYKAPSEPTLDSAKSPRSVPTKSKIEANWSQDPVRNLWTPPIYFALASLYTLADYVATAFGFVSRVISLYPNQYIPSYECEAFLIPCSPMGVHHLIALFVDTR